MKRNAFVLIAVVVLVAAVIYAGARLSRHPEAVAQASLTVEHAQGSLAPDFTLQTLQGASFQLSQLRGKAVLINFWATWCEPCKIEMPWLVELYHQYRPQGLEVVGVAMDDSGHQAIADFVKAMHVDYTIVQGKESVGDAYGGMPFLPETFILDRQGRVVKTLIGIHSESDFEDGIKQALGLHGEAPSSTPAMKPAAAKASQ